MADNEEWLQELVFGSVCKRRKLWSKLLRICGNSKEYAMNISLDFRIMEEVKTYRHSGVDILNDGRMSKGVNHRTGEARKTAGALVTLW